jgi:RecJ-like exonuclease
MSTPTYSDPFSMESIARGLGLQPVEEPEPTREERAIAERLACTQCNGSGLEDVYPACRTCGGTGARFCQVCEVEPATDVMSEKVVACGSCAARRWGR